MNVGFRLTGFNSGAWLEKSQSDSLLRGMKLDPEQAHHGIVIFSAIRPKLEQVDDKFFEPIDPDNPGTIPDPEPPLPPGIDDPDGGISGDINND